MTKHNKQIGLCLAAFWLAGCSLAPTYERPAAPVPAAWQAPGAGDRAAASIGWQEFFSDERLRAVIERSLASNRDLRVAAANIEQARAQYGIQRAALFPAVNATASETASRTPAAMSSTGRDTVSHTYSAGVGISAWELDVFGRVRSLRDQALAQFLSTEETKRSVELSLVAEVAGAWLTLATDRERLEVAKATLKAQQDALTLVQGRFNAGTVSALDLAQA
ncbi:TolC family protein [Candidatus Dactylopiibacterium carminicum]|uniref:TolC family protein n=1 Tax=Candidatus Dactylopiibacterium carminicum TaxID=857335 RepID=UPI0026AFF7E5|nr:TolC family protein [Candidatus Dactylopiibacterium carminicum]